MPTDPVEFSRTLANDDQQRCGNRVQLEDENAAAITAANPLPTTAAIPGLADPLPVTLEDAAGNATGVNANPVQIGDAGGSLSVDDGGAVLSVDDAGGSLTVDNGGVALGVDDAGGSLTVDQATHDNFNANVNLQVGDADASNANPVPGDIITMPAAAWTTLINAIVLDDDPTEYNSALYDVAGESAVWVLIGIESAGAPTNIRILAQISHDAGTTWWDFEEGLWASLYWEDTDTAAGILKAFLLPVGGVDAVRIRAVATGTDGNNTFTVTVRVRSFRGNFGVAHA